MLNKLLLITFVITNLAPLTGIHMHKMVSTIYLLLTVIHTIKFCKRLGWKRYLLLGIVFIAFVSGVLGMIFEQFPIIAALHLAISIVSVFFLAIHIFVYHKKI